MEDIRSGQYSSKKFDKSRNLILAIVACSIVLPSFASSVYLPCIINIRQSLHTSDFYIALTICGFNLALAFMPIVWGTVSAIYGRKAMLLASLLIVLGGSLMCTGAWNVASLILFRTIMGIGAAGPVIIGTGIVGDIFPLSAKPRALAKMMVPSLLGIIIGPPFGGIITEFMGWRWSFMIISIATVFTIIAVITLLPETADFDSPYAPTSSFDGFFAFKYLLRLRTGIPALCRAFAFSGMYVAMWAFPLVLTKDDDLPAWLIGVLFMPYGIGTTAGSALGNIFSEFFRQRYGIGGRLVPFFAGSILMAVILVIYGWVVAIDLTVVGTALGTISLAIIGFTLTIGRPSVINFALEQVDDPSGYSVAVISLQFLMSVIELAIAPKIFDHFEVQIATGITVSIAAGFLILACIPVGVLMIDRMRQKDVQLESFKSFQIHNSL